MLAWWLQRQHLVNSTQSKVSVCWKPVGSDSGQKLVLACCLYAVAASGQQSSHRTGVRAPLFAMTAAPECIACNLAGHLAACMSMCQNTYMAKSWLNFLVRIRGELIDSPQSKVIMRSESCSLAQITSFWMAR